MICLEKLVCGYRNLRGDSKYGTNNSRELTVSSWKQKKKRI